MAAAMKATPVVLLFCAITLTNWMVAEGDRENHASELENRPLAGRFRRQCPTGLWCGKKREIKKVPNKLIQLVKRLSQCPTGLWCGKKRGIGGAFNSKAVTKNFQKLTRRQKCPTGLWCGKKRNFVPESFNPEKKPSAKISPGIMSLQGASFPSDVIKPVEYHTTKNNNNGNRRYNFE